MLFFKTHWAFSAVFVFKMFNRPPFSNEFEKPSEITVVVHEKVNGNHLQHFKWD